MLDIVHGILGVGILMPSGNWLSLYWHMFQLFLFSALWRQLGLNLEHC